MGTVIHDQLGERYKYDEFFFDHWKTVNSSELGAPEPDQGNSVYLQNLTTGFPQNGNTSSLSSSSAEADFSKDSGIFSELELTYIGRMLMEDDIEDKLDMYQGHPALEATEKPFYDILGEKYPPSPDQPPLYSNSLDSPDGSIYANSNGGSISSGSDCDWPYAAVEFPSPENYPLSLGDYSQLSLKSTNSHRDVSGGSVATGDAFSESLPALQFRKGVKEARRFLPGDDKLVIDLESIHSKLPYQEPGDDKLVIDLESIHSKLPYQEPNVGSVFIEAKVEEERDYSIYGLKGRKNPHSDDLDVEEGRSNKQSAVSYSEETLRSKLSDMVLLCNGKYNTAVSELREAKQNEASRSVQNGHSKGSGGGKARGRKQTKSEAVDLRTLLIHCAEAVAADSRRSANELLKQIRQHSSPFGDGTQRLAHCFADGLEARLAGTGSQKYNSLVAKPVTVTDILKAYQLFLAACPFKKIAYFLSGQTILNVSENASRVHIIDFGIYFGFQWPWFMQRLSNRPGGPPKLRITGIELPQKGFRPAERVEETGRRLAEYARSFNVPFEYHAIAAKWETIEVEDLKVDKDEMLFVNFIFRSRNLPEETGVVDCPRSKVLNTIRRLNPAVFIHAVVNGSFNAPFFVTRFREALFHFSTLFDVLETNVPRENEPRLLIERDLFGREALNVIACEGSDRVERPETYKQWNARNLRAGFSPLPINQEIFKIATGKITADHHKDFIIDEDNRWLLMGWKGRITHALSTWKPNSTRVF